MKARATTIGLHKRIVESSGEEIYFVLDLSQ